MAWTLILQNRIPFFRYAIYLVKSPFVCGIIIESLLGIPVTARQKDLRYLHERLFGHFSFWLMHSTIVPMSWAQSASALSRNRYWNGNYRYFLDFNVFVFPDSEFQSIGINPQVYYPVYPVISVRATKFSMSHHPCRVFLCYG